MSRHAGLAVLLACALLPRLATFRSASGGPPPHGETDERVFTTLVAQVRSHPLRYTLQGTPILAQLEPLNYDKPVFVHPPAFVYLCAALNLVAVPLRLVPVLLDLAAIACVYLLALRLYGEREALWAAFLLAACPVTWFVSQHLWIDSMLVFAVALSLVAAERAGRLGTPSSWALAGAAFALAFLSKITAVLALPGVIAIALHRDRGALSWRKAGVAAAAAAIPSLLWLAALRIGNGQWLPSGFPTAEMMRRYPFVAAMVARPWHYYLSSLALLAPVFLLALRRVRARNRADLGTALAALGFFAGMTAIGLMRGGYQTRYVAPAYPALAVLAGAAVAQLPPGGIIAAAALVAYGVVGAAGYAVFQTPQFADFGPSAAGQFLALFR